MPYTVRFDDGHSIEYDTYTPRLRVDVVNESLIAGFDIHTDPVEQLDRALEAVASSITDQIRNAAMANQEFQQYATRYRNTHRARGTYATAAPGRDYGRYLGAGRPAPITPEEVPDRTTPAFTPAATGARDAMQYMEMAQAREVDRAVGRIQQGRFEGTIGANSSVWAKPKKPTVKSILTKMKRGR